MDITIVSIGIENAGNLGAIARVMKNFGQKKLLLIDPTVNPKDGDAIARAKHAQEVLSNAKIADISALKQFDIVIGTTSALGTDYNIPRSPMTAEQLSEKLLKESHGKKIAIVFGPEGTGLSNEHIRLMDFTVTIPTSREYAALNLSHSITIILYELSKTELKEKIGDDIETCNGQYKDVLMKKIKDVISRMDFDDERKENTQHIVWKRLLGKAMLTKREAFALMGFFSKLEHMRGKNDK